MVNEQHKFSDVFTLPKSRLIIILIITSLAAFTTHFFEYLVNVALPTIGAEMAVPVHDLSWMNICYLLANVIFIIPGIYVADKLGYKKTFIIGGLIAGISALATIIVPSYQIILISRVFSGAGSAFVTLTTLAILMKVYPKDKHPFVISVNVASTFIGYILGSAVGGAMVEIFRWQSPFLIAVVGYLLSGILLAIFMKADAATSVKRFNWGECLLYAVSIALLMFGLSTIGDVKFAPFIALAGAILFAIFIRSEFKRESPLLHVRLFVKNRAFAQASLVTVLYMLACEGTVYMMTIYLQSVGRIDAFVCGLVLMLKPLSQLVSTPVVEIFSKKYDARHLVTLGMAVTVVGLIIIAGPGTTLETLLLLAIIISSILLGIGAALYTVPNRVVLMEAVPPEEYSTAAGIDAFTRYIGRLMSLAVCTVTIGFVVGGGVVMAPELHDGFISALRISMLICAVFGVVATVVSWARTKKSNIRDPQQV